MKPVIATILLLGVSARAESTVPYPAEYRKWQVTKTYVIGPGSKVYAKSGGMHHYYANEAAREGFRTGKFPRGAIIVDERLKTKQEDGVTEEGERHGVAVMMKDPDKYRDTGGWGFDRFVGDTRTDGADAELRSRCFNCHVGAKDKDFVFSTPRK